MSFAFPTCIEDVKLTDDYWEVRMLILW